MREHFHQGAGKSGTRQDQDLPRPVTTSKTTGARCGRAPSPTCGRTDAPRGDFKRNCEAARLLPAATDVVLIDEGAIVDPVEKGE